MHSNESFANVKRVSHYELLTSSDDALPAILLSCNLLCVTPSGNTAKLMKKREKISEAVNI